MTQTPFPSRFYNPDEDEERLLREAQLSPAQQDALARKRFEQGTQRGFVELGSKALGIETPQQHRALANQELTELAKRMRPGSVEFYTAAADILRKHGLVAEADAMMAKARELAPVRGADPKVLQLQRARDELLKRPDADSPQVKSALEAINREMSQLGVPREGSKTQEKDYEYYRRLRDQASAAGNNALAAEYQKVMDSLLRKGEKQADPIAAAREARLAKKDAMAEVAAKKATVRSLQAVARTVGQDLNAAKRLLGHPGLDAIVGQEILGENTQRTRALVDKKAAGALAVFLNVQARTFLTALQDLKSTSKAGVSGLGQLTEREGDKIQNAKVALDPQQPADQFRRTLTEYINQLQSTYNAAAQELGSVGETVPALPAPISDIPSRPSATPTAPPQKPTRPTPSGAVPAPTSGKKWTGRLLSGPR